MSDDDTFDYVSGYDRMWQAQHDANNALVRVACELDTALEEIELLHASAALARMELDTAIAMRWKSERNSWLCIERARRFIADDDTRPY